MYTNTAPSPLKIGSLVQLNNVVFKIVSFDKPYTQFAGHYTVQSLEMIDWLMVFNATYNNISVISWRSVLLVEEIGVPGENQQVT